MMPASSNSECDQFDEGTRLRAICEGTVDLPLYKINAYRENMGLAPLYGVDPQPTGSREKPIRRQPKVKKQSPTRSVQGGCKGCGGTRRSSVAPRPNGWGPGSQLLKDFEAAGVPHCPECIDLAGRMDRWGKRGCLHRLENIVDEMLPRAKTWMAENRPWLRRLVAITKLEDTALRVALRIKIKNAIHKAPERSPRRKKARSSRKRTHFPTGKHWARSFKVTHDEPPYVTVENLARDTLSLMPHLPADVTHVVGSARSGLVPATLLSEMLHVPLTVVRNRMGDYVPASHGWRLLEGRPKYQGTTLVVDDTTMTGNSLLRIKQVLKTMPGKKLFAAVYVNPAAVNKPDLWARDLPWPHLLEWNLFNSLLLESFALDFDGILCHDCPAADDDDGPRYERWMREVRPFHLVRKRPIKLVITARLEKYRPQTVEWMQRWGMRAKSLVMGPWTTIADRRRSDVAAWKAEQLDRFLRKRGGIPPKMFIESDPGQAKQIAEITGGLVVCPAARRCFGKAKR